MGSRAFRNLVASAAALACGAGVEAAVLTVGPSGGSRSVQAALERAASLTGINEVRIEQGTHVENVHLAPCCAGVLSVSGGWDRRFRTRLADPEATMLDGGAVGPVLRIESVRSGALILHNLTLRNGRVALPDRTGSGWGFGFGAGVGASVSGDGQFWLHSVHIRDNVIAADGPDEVEGQGAGAAFYLNGDSKLTVEDCAFERNRLEAAEGTRLRAHGGGMELQVFGGQARVVRSVFYDNHVGGNSVANGGGLVVLVQGPPRRAVELEDLRFVRNSTAEGGGASGASLLVGNGGVGPDIVMRRGRFAKNGAGRYQLDVSAVRGSYVVVSDTLVVRGDYGGVHAFGRDASYIDLTNLSVADNTRAGIDIQGLAAKVSVFNSIAHGNGPSDLRMSGTAFGGFNLVGVDPLFVKRTGGDYRLLPGSPARDAGTAAPPGSLGPRDLDGGARVVGSGVDVGADEID